MYHQIGLPSTTPPQQHFDKMEIFVETRISEIASGIYRLSTFVPRHRPARGLLFQPVPGSRRRAADVSHRLAQDVSAQPRRREPAYPARALRWITFGHYEADECGAMNEWLAVAPQAQVAHGQTGCLVSLNDMADRAPRVLQGRRNDRPRRRQAGALHRHAAHSAWLGRRRAVRRDRPANLDVRRPVHPARRTALR